MDNLNDNFYAEAWEQDWFTGRRIFKNSSNVKGKINLGKQKSFQIHRSGWNYVLDILSGLHNEEGTIFDGFLESTFLWDWAMLAKEDKIPYKKPWIGCLHNPHNMPLWFNYRDSPQSLFAQISYLESLPQCRGFFAFSQYHADFIRRETGLPVSVLHHPTEIPDNKFSFENFLKNRNKKMVTIGWWLRKLNSIYQVPLDKNSAYTKIRLFSYPTDSKPMAFLRDITAKERDIMKLTFEEKYESNTEHCNYLSNEEYDRMLNENIVFLDLYDSSANNTVIECIARQTPILVSPLPAVKEYLGEDYPFYFNSQKEAAEKAMDFDLVEKTCNYLKNLNTGKKIAKEYFLNAFVNSEVYALL